MGDIDYSTLPEHMQDGVRDYIERGYKPGSFLQAVLRNDLVGAFGHADSINLGALQEWARWLYNDAPSGCWGSEAKITAWIVARGPGAAL